MPLCAKRFKEFYTAFQKLKPTVLLTTLHYVILWYFIVFYCNQSYLPFFLGETVKKETNRNTKK